ncbi:hypothetical protein NKH50_09750 [Mesorhizobium sp. M1027]
MPPPDNKRHLIEYTTVDVSLYRKPLERIAIAFEFEASQFAVDNGKINANGARPHAHLFNDASVYVVSVQGLQVISHR